MTELGYSQNEALYGRLLKQLLEPVTDDAGQSEDERIHNQRETSNWMAANSKFDSQILRKWLTIMEQQQFDNNNRFMSVIDDAKINQSVHSEWPLTLIQGKQANQANPFTRSGTTSQDKVKRRPMFANYNEFDNGLGFKRNQTHSLYPGTSRSQVNGYRRSAKHDGKSQQSSRISKPISSSSLSSSGRQRDSSIAQTSNSYRPRAPTIKNIPTYQVGVGHATPSVAMMNPQDQFSQSSLDNRERQSTKQTAVNNRDNLNEEQSKVSRVLHWKANQNTKNGLPSGTEPQYNSATKNINKPQSGHHSNTNRISSLFPNKVASDSSRNHNQVYGRVRNRGVRELGGGGSRRPYPVPLIGMFHFVLLGALS